MTFDKMTLGIMTFGIREKITFDKNTHNNATKHNHRGITINT